jgi:hypothetical protein
MNYIQPNELRLGNYVIVENDLREESNSIHEITEIRQLDCQVRQNELGNYYGQKYKFIKPVLITKELILKLGFIKDKTLDNMYWHPIYERVYLHWISCINIHLGNKSGSIKMVQFLHELQNVFYSNIEDELTLNTNN